jgi:flagellar operon protein (TIGR03826 family)
MEVRNCKQCGRLYNYIGGSYRNLCPDCIRLVEDKFEGVKQFIEEHKTATMPQIAEHCEVSTRQIEQWIREERLCFADDSPIGIACESCGAMIKSGRYCDKCKSNMVNQFGSMYRQQRNSMPNRNMGSDRDSARMRYFDK